MGAREFRRLMKSGVIIILPRSWRAPTVSSPWNSFPPQIRMLGYVSWTTRVVTIGWETLDNRLCLPPTHSPLFTNLPVFKGFSHRDIGYSVVDYHLKYAGWSGWYCTWPASLRIWAWECCRIRRSFVLCMVVHLRSRFSRFCNAGTGSVGSVFCWMKASMIPWRQTRQDSKNYASWNCQFSEKEVELFPWVSMQVEHCTVLCMDRVNRSVNTHNFGPDVVNLLDTATPTQPRK